MSVIIWSAAGRIAVNYASGFNGPLNSSIASGVTMIPGEMELMRAPFSPHLTASAITRFSLQRFAIWYVCSVSLIFSGFNISRFNNICYKKNLFEIFRQIDCPRRNPFRKMLIMRNCNDSHIVFFRFRQHNIPYLRLCDHI